MRFLNHGVTWEIKITEEEMRIMRNRSKHFAIAILPEAKVGDHVRFQEYDFDREIYLENSMRKRIIYLDTETPGLQSGYVAIGFDDY
jgi:uncharacterized protein (DUF169 family)